jgi:hypothetical protein
MPDKTITVQFTVQNEDDFFASIEEGMISDQSGYSSYTVLDFDDSDSSGEDNESLFLDDFNPASKEVIDAANEIVESIVAKANKSISPALSSWRILYGEFLENEILSDKFSNFGDILFEIEDSNTPYCVLKFVEDSGWECHQDFMGGEEIYYSSLFDQPE